MLCAVALGDTDLMRQAFVQLLQVRCSLGEWGSVLKEKTQQLAALAGPLTAKRAQPLPCSSSAPRTQVPPYADDSLAGESSEEEASASGAEPDALHGELQAAQAEVDGYILTAARLVAPLLHEGSWARGFDWCREQLGAAGYSALASEVQLARANAHLGQREYGAAVAALKEFERGDSRQRARSAVNLSSLALLEGQLEGAAGYADYCCEADPGSPAALVSRGNVHLAQGAAEAALQVGHEEERGRRRQRWLDGCQTRSGRASKPPELRGD